MSSCATNQASPSGNAPFEAMLFRPLSGLPRFGRPDFSRKRDRLLSRSHTQTVSRADSSLTLQQELLSLPFGHHHRTGQVTVLVHRPVSLSRATLHNRQQQRQDPDFQLHSENSSLLPSRIQLFPLSLWRLEGTSRIRLLRLGGGRFLPRKDPGSINARHHYSLNSCLYRQVLSRSANQAQ